MQKWLVHFPASSNFLRELARKAKNPSALAESRQLQARKKTLSEKNGGKQKNAQELPRCCVISCKVAAIRAELNQPDCIFWKQRSQGTDLQKCFDDAASVDL